MTAPLSARSKRPKMQHPGKPGAGFTGAQRSLGGDGCSLTRTGSERNARDRKQAKAATVATLAAKLTALNGRQPTDEELARKLARPVKAVIRLRRLAEDRSQ